MIKCLVLSSGAYEVFLQISAIKLLLDNKYIDFDEIEEYYGTSAGVLTTILCTLGLDFETVYNYTVERPWNKLFNIDAEKIINSYQKCGIFDRDIFDIGFKPLFKLGEIPTNITLKEYYLKTNKIINIFATNTTNFSVKKFNYITDPDLELLEAAYMSCSIPVLFKPHKYKEIIYNDGALLCRFPINEAISEKKYKDDELLGITIHPRFSNIGNVNDDDLFQYVISYLKNYIENKVLVTAETVNNNIKILNIIRRSEDDSYVFNLLGDSEFRKNIMEMVEKDIDIFLNESKGAL